MHVCHVPTYLYIVILDSNIPVLFLPAVDSREKELLVKLKCLKLKEHKWQNKCLLVMRLKRMWVWIKVLVWMLKWVRVGHSMLMEVKIQMTLTAVIPLRG